MSIADLVPKGEGWIVKELKEIKRSIGKLSTARTGNAMTVDGKPGITVQHGGAVAVYDGGAFTLVTPTGRVVLQASTTLIPDGSGRTQQSFVLARDDGTVALYLSDQGTVLNHAHQQALTILDRAGNTIFAEDTVSGVGLARPWLSLGQWDDQSAPTVTTTSSTYTVLSVLGGYRQQPKVYVQALVRASDATTAGSMQLLSGTTVLDTQPIPAGTFAYLSFATVALPAGAFGDPLLLKIQACRTAGTGTIGVRGTTAIGAQS